MFRRSVVIVTFASLVLASNPRPRLMGLSWASVWSWISESNTCFGGFKVMNRPTDWLIEAAWSALCRRNVAIYCGDEPVQTAHFCPLTLKTFAVAVLSLEEHLKWNADMCFRSLCTYCTLLCVLTELNMAHNPSDHPRASTIFLSKSQNDGE